MLFLFTIDDPSADAGRANILIRSVNEETAIEHFKGHFKYKHRLPRDADCVHWDDDDFGVLHSTLEEGNGLEKLAVQHGLTIEEVMSIYNYWSSDSRILILTQDEYWAKIEETCKRWAAGDKEMKT